VDVEARRRISWWMRLLLKLLVSGILGRKSERLGLAATRMIQRGVACRPR
jgi:hypothetical protein